MNIVEVNLTNGIRWPSKCAYCNGEASAEAKTHFRVIDGFFLVAIRETTHTVKYPVCSKHRWVARFYGFVTNQAWPTGFVMVLAFPALLFLPLMLGAPFGLKFGDETAIALYATFAAWVIYLKLRNPVKIVTAKKALARVRFSNRQYAEEFSRVNAVQ